MSAQLSKLHVRFIQSQKNFDLLYEQGKQSKKLPLSQLYVKDNSNFYLILQNKPHIEDKNVTIRFDETTPALKRLECSVTKEEIPQGSEEYEETLLFFNVDTTQDTQVFLLNIIALDDK